MIQNYGFFTTLRQVISWSIKSWTLCNNEKKKNGKPVRKSNSKEIHSSTNDPFMTCAVTF